MGTKCPGIGNFQLSHLSSTPRPQDTQLGFPQKIVSRLYFIYHMIMAELQNCMQDSDPVRVFRVSLTANVIR